MLSVVGIAMLETVVSLGPLCVTFPLHLTQSFGGYFINYHSRHTCFSVLQGLGADVYAIANSAPFYY